MRLNKKNSKIALLCSLSVLFIACAANRNATQLYSQAEIAVKQAEQEGAPEHAKLELHTARENLTKSKTALEENEEIVAARFAEKALVEADFAEKKAQSKKAQMRTIDIEKNIELLEQEANR
jgi:hypothetical protein